jgi:tRNA 5-methylaminomethyl-2-thiouridine biosynthesis bifunctional protein
MDARAPSLAPLACDLPNAWASNSAWRILDTQFGTGAFFLATWQSWRDDPNRPQLLHFVAFSPAAPPLEAMVSEGTPTPAWQSLLDELKPHWFGLLPGFHRINLNDGNVLLTLCIGSTAELLRQQHFFADSVYLGDGASDEHAMWDVWTTKALARCCRRGTRLSLRRGSAQEVSVLAQCGFVFDSNDEFDKKSAVFDPRWTLKNSRNPSIPAATQPGTCAVIGAGLAGASVAASLARRGWQVVVLDGAATPACGASGLPVGLLTPHGSADDCKLSRLTRAGVRLMLGEATRYLNHGRDWALTGSKEYRVDGSQGLPEHWPREGSDWSHSVPPTDHDNVPSVWHSRSAWIKPAHLVRAWLSLPNISFQGGAQVASLAMIDGRWSVLGAEGLLLTIADRVVIANATGALPLLQQVQADWPELPLHLDRLPTLQGVRGQLSFGRHAHTTQAEFPPTPINGAGSVIPFIPTDDGLTWYIGSSFQPDTQPINTIEKNHEANFERLRILRPRLAKQIKPQFDTSNIYDWGNTRCVTVDRLPVVGAMGGPQETSLWVCAGMGSRGLIFSVLCAELLAAQWGGEPLPIEFNLAQSFNALRAGR